MRLRFVAICTLSALLTVASATAFTQSAPATLPTATATAPATRTAPPATRAAGQPIPRNFAQWEREIAAYETADRANPPPRDAMLFVGSSTIRMWRTLAQDFAGQAVLNRGFGGSEIADVTHFAERIIFPYQPKTIVLRSGSNDLHVGRSPEEVAADFAAFAAKVRQRLPETEICFLSLSPVPSRWTERDASVKLNTLIREQIAKLTRARYIDTWDVTLNAQGQAREDIFLADRLHLNAEGYKLLIEKVRPHFPPPPPK